MTRELLNRIKEENETVYKKIEALKLICKDHKRIGENQAMGYLLALEDIGFINNTGVRLLYIYITL